ncbi:MAG: ATP-binding protein, partial [Candidatus Dormibacteria bacterium]
AWAFTRSREGRALIQRLSRTGRSRNVALGLLTQNAGDLLDSTIKGTLTASFCFRADDGDEIRDVLALLKVEDSPAHIAAVRGLERGQCLYRDECGRVACVDVDLVLQEFLAAFDTTPGVHSPPPASRSDGTVPASPLRVV